MIRFFIVLVALIFATLPMQAKAVNWPDWVEKNVLPAADADPKDFIDDGVHHMLYDIQVQLNPEGYDRFSRRVVKVISRGGLEEVGAARFYFDPADEELIVHGIWREREGVRSKIENLDYIDIRRESELDYGILDGRLTRYADINDLRVGDTIDISWTTRVKPTVFPEHFLYWRTEKPLYGYQIDQFRLFAPHGRDITITGPAVPITSPLDGGTSYLWRHADTPVPDRGDSTKSWKAFYGDTQISTASNWNTIADRVVDAYTPQPLPAELLNAVNEFEGTEAQRVTAAFRLVQEQIRYMGIEIGAGGYLPRTPSTVWSRRFGDCKDKALLLVSILEYMGISSDVVLVNLDDGENLADYAPSPFLFNHAIVRVHGQGGPYFLDPTDVLQGGFGDAIRTSNFEWALPITAQSDALVAVPQQPVRDPTYEVLSRYEFANEGDLAARLNVETTYRGEGADYQRYQYDLNGTDDRAESYLEWYEKRYPGAHTLTPLYVKDDLDTNVLIVYEHYGLTDEGLAEHRAEFWMNPYAIKGELEKIPEEGIDAPFKVGPLFHRHRVELVGAPNLKVPREITMENPFFRYTRVGSEIDGGVAAEFEIEVLTTEIQPSDAEAYQEAVDAQDRRDDRRFNLGLSERIFATPLAMGATIKSAITFGSFLFVAFIVLFAGRRGYTAERAARTPKARPEPNTSPAI